VYQGAIDDNPQVVSDVDTHYLIEALEEVITGNSPDESYMRPAGCVIKKQ
jgi:hypothetical protein